MKKILAQATVDDLRPGLYEVHVMGHGEHRRNYVIHERDESRAAHEGIRQYVSEMENLVE